MPTRMMILSAEVLIVPSTAQSTRTLTMRIRLGVTGISSPCPRRDEPGVSGVISVSLRGLAWAEIYLTAFRRILDRFRLLYFCLVDRKYSSRIWTESPTGNWRCGKYIAFFLGRTMLM